ncbi:MAG: hypothetical protein PHT75_02645 [Bacilli bacterium]|nr:hypothetical protein [Bacilli bacterium]MDD3305008.1 hypothetical protein [Bacilli bacterium]MDD4053661.1 hypothetical protein [Bacilli bacterium]MDD4411160.1 hypothetical protein [Bacilli bacterium]
MREKVKILTCCSHFDEIVNYDFLEDDIFTKKVIQYYQDFVFKVDENVKNLDLIKKLDEAVYKYMEDYHFAKSIRDTLDLDLVTSDNFAYLDQLMQYFIDFSGQYDETAATVVTTKWI